VGLDFPYMDTFQNLSQSFKLKEIDFILELNSFSREKLNSNYGPSWKQKDFLIQEKMENYFENESSFSDLAVYHEILDFVPENSFLHLANSSVIRYSLLFDPVKSITYFGNRGTSGIDGSSSTALGHAAAKPMDWNTLITGDMSFFYDSNAFWNHQSVPNFRIFLINNGGGSIFKIIPGPDSTKELDDFFVFNNNFSAEHICKTFRLIYYKSCNLKDIESQMEEFYTFEEAGSAKLMEIFTAGCENEEILKDFFKKVKL
jgi:2-succinyl-5-enolpyruvyl-6-hydroxy-3-cyclohexene-1-carboxylate synthase